MVEPAKDDGRQHRVIHIDSWRSHARLCQPRKDREVDGVDQHRSRDFDDIAHALLGQHPKIHVEEKQAPHERKPGSDVRTRKPTRKWTRYANLAEWYADDEEEEETDHHSPHWHYDDEEGEGEAEHESESGNVDDVELDVFTCLLCEGFDHESMAPLIQAESISFLEWNKFGEGGGEGEGKSGKGRPRFSAGTKPGLSLEDRKKAFQKLKSETKCNECGEFGHWVGDDSCKMNRKSKSAYYSAQTSTDTGLPDTQDESGTLWSMFAEQQIEGTAPIKEEYVYAASGALEALHDPEEETPVFLPNTSCSIATR